MLGFSSLGEVSLGEEDVDAAFTPTTYFAQVQIAVTTEALVVILAPSLTANWEG